MLLPDVSDIVDIVSLVLHTGGLANRRPVSALLCSPADNGKTTFIMDRFLGNPGIHRPNIATRIGLARWLLQRNNWRNYHHIMLPDMTSSLAGERASAQTFQSFLMALVYDGITDFHTFYLPYIQVDHPVVVGVIAGIVPSTYHKRKDEWAESGFLRRFLPVSFDYSPEQDKVIQEICLQGRNSQPYMLNLNMTLWGRAITVDDELVLKLAPLVDNLVNGMQLKDKDLMKGHTYAEMLRSLVLAHALRRGSAIAEALDVGAVIRLTKYLNFQLTIVDSLEVRR